MKLWEKGIKIDKLIEDFTVGNDRNIDMYLAKWDVIGSLAHIKMLNSIGLLNNEEYSILNKGLTEIYNDIINNKFYIENTVEDIHSEVELLLTKKYGEAGKKIHSGRSRNDQVLLDIKLFTRQKIEEVVTSVKKLFETLINQSEKNKNILMPGYTHLQAAMPSSFGLWFGAYAESLSDDLLLLQTAFQIANQNPLGSAAGYGTSFPLNRQLTTDLLGFETLSFNSVYAQMGRGKIEKTTAFAISSVASTLNKMSSDICLFVSQNFQFVLLPDEFTTGSSIMPHKKNPDIFELIRSRCNQIMALPNEINLQTTNLPSGYFRDYQLLKENYLSSFDKIIQCIEILNYSLQNIKINESIINDEKYKYIFSVEELNRLVLQGIPFRDAYKQIAKSIENNTYSPNKIINHTHEGSIGNLCNDKISEKFFKILKNFPFEKIQNCIDNLIHNNI
jgi:argininosuccinate lyase